MATISRVAASSVPPMTSPSKVTTATCSGVSWLWSPVAASSMCSVPGKRTLILPCPLCDMTPAWKSRWVACTSCSFNACVASLVIWLFLSALRSLFCRPTTVNRLRAARNAAGGIGAEESGELRYLSRLQQAVDGPLRHHDFFYHLVFRDAVRFRLVSDLFFYQCSTHVRWADSVTGYTMIACFKGGDAGQSDQSMLGGYIRGFIA